MSELNRAEFIKINMGSMHRLDVRATTGRLLTFSEERHFRAQDVIDELEDYAPERVWPVFLQREIATMNRAGMIQHKHTKPSRYPDGGKYYEMVDTEESRLSWGIVKAVGLAVVRLYPDAPRNKAWDRFVFPAE